MKGTEKAGIFSPQPSGMLGTSSRKVSAWDLCEPILVVMSGEFCKSAGAAQSDSKEFTQPGSMERCSVCEVLEVSLFNPKPQNRQL